MSILDGILYMLWRGLAIGIIISAPMGPVGILCVQRTLDKGRKVGLYTGVGAAISDLLYCLLTGFGLSFVEEFLEKNSDIIQLLGSVVLIAFGVYLFKSNPSQNLKKPVDNQISVGRNILNGFLFTVSNPLIIFLIIGLFARFNFLLPDIHFHEYIVGFLCIIGGALLWWFIVTYAVDKVRRHFNLRSMWLINKIIGSVIFIFAIVGIISATGGLMKGAVVKPLKIEREGIYMNSVRGFSGFKSSTDSTLIIENPSVGKRSEVVTDLITIPRLKGFEWSFRVMNVDPVPSKGFSLSNISGLWRKGGSEELSPWGVLLEGGDNEQLWIRFKPVDNKKLEISVDAHCEMIVKLGNSVVLSQKIKSGMDFHSGWNAFSLVYDSGSLTLSGGDRNYDLLIENLSLPFVPEKIGYFVEGGGKLRVDNFSFRRIGAEESHVVRDSYPIEEFQRKLKGKSNDPLEGIWMFYDRSLDENFLKAGGDYKLAIFKDKGEYVVVYMSGAKVNGSDWEPGMVKGKLKPTPFQGIYNVEWIDAGGRLVCGEIKAEYNAPLLRIIFPDHNSELRLAKPTK